MLTEDKETRPEVLARSQLPYVKKVQHFKLFLRHLLHNPFLQVSLLAHPGSGSKWLSALLQAAAAMSAGAFDLEESRHFQRRTSK